MNSANIFAGTVAETVGSKDHQPPCNCARCAGRLQKRVPIFCFIYEIMEFKSGLKLK